MHNVNLNDVNEMKNYKNSQWIKQCEDAFAKQIGDVTDDICKNKKPYRLIRSFGGDAETCTPVLNDLIRVSTYLAFTYS